MPISNKGAANILVIVVVIAIVAIGGYLIYQNKTTFISSDKPTSNKHTYESDKYGYSLEYPKNYVINDSPDYPGHQANLLFRKANAGKYDWIISINMEKDLDDMSFEEYTERAVLSACAADGPGVSILCDQVTKRAEITTNNGFDGYQLFINEVTLTYEQDKEIRKERTKGPIYTVNIPEDTSQLVRVIIVSPVNDVALTADEEKSMQDITDSIKFNNSPQANYINGVWEFTLQIPQGFLVEGEGTLLHVVKKPSADNETPSPEMNIKIEQGNKTTIDASGEITVVSQESVSINSIQGHKTIVSYKDYPEGSQCPIYRLHKNGTVYEFSLYECLDSAIFEPVVQSFKRI